MPKEWGSEKPKLSKFTKAVPDDAGELFAALNELAENWKHVSKCGVVRDHRAILIDLSWLANSQRPDFYIPLKESEVETADRLVKHIVSKVEQHSPIEMSDAEALFGTISSA